MRVTPLQIWLPRFGESINKRPEIRRDAMRAFADWRGELVVWMLPEIGSTTRWRLDGVSNVAIHSEEFERIDIAHLTEDGYIHAARPKGIAPATIDGLLDAWLNAQKGGGFSYVRPPESVTVAAPHIDLDGKISARKRTFTFGPGAYMPFDSVDRETRQVTMIWPPKGSPSTVSPEAESARKFPSKKLESDSSIVVTERGNKALRVFLRWPEPLASLMPLLSGADDMLAQAQMVRCARQSASDLPSALTAATVAGQPYLFDGYSTG